MNCTKLPRKRQEKRGVKNGKESASRFLWGTGKRYWWEGLRESGQVRRTEEKSRLSSVNGEGGLDRSHHEAGKVGGKMNEKAKRRVSEKRRLVLKFQNRPFENRV